MIVRNISYQIAKFLSRKKLGLLQITWSGSLRVFGKVLAIEGFHPLPVGAPIRTEGKTVNELDLMGLFVTSDSTRYKIDQLLHL